MKIRTLTVSFLFGSGLHEVHQWEMQAILDCHAADSQKTEVHTVKLCTKIHLFHKSEMKTEVMDYTLNSRGATEEFLPDHMSFINAA